MSFTTQKLYTHTLIHIHVHSLRCTHSLSPTHTHMYTTFMSTFTYTRTHMTHTRHTHIYPPTLVHMLYARTYSHTTHTHTHTPHSHTHKHTVIHTLIHNPTLHIHTLTTSYTHTEKTWTGRKHRPNMWMKYVPNHQLSEKSGLNAYRHASTLLKGIQLMRLTARISLGMWGKLNRVCGVSSYGGIKDCAKTTQSLKDLRICAKSQDLWVST